MWSKTLFASVLVFVNFSFVCGQTFHEKTHWKGVDAKYFVGFGGPMDDVSHTKLLMYALETDFRLIPHLTPNSYELGGTDFRTFSLAAQFKPFEDKSHLFKSLEMGCGIGFHSLRSNGNFTYYPINEDNKKAYWWHKAQGVHFAPSLLWSTGNWKRFKAYFGTELGIYRHFSNQLELADGHLYYLYNQVTSNIDEFEHAINFATYSGSYLGGIKLYLDCRWNFHLEYKGNYIMHRLNNIYSESTYQGITFGLRYKIGVDPAEAEEDILKKSIFW